jgi:hypothetical protein
MPRKPANLYELGLAELDDLSVAERAALNRRLTPEQICRERHEMAEDMALLLLRDLDADAPRDVRESLELCLLCLDEIRAGLKLPDRGMTVVNKPKPRRTTEEGDHAGVL